MFSFISEKYTACVLRRLKVAVVCVFRTLTTPDVSVPVWKVTISMIFRLKGCHKIEWGRGLLWNSSFVIIISHLTFYIL